MTEKRFRTNYVGCIVDYEDNLKNYDGDEIVDLLNKLNEIIHFKNKHLQCLQHIIRCTSIETRKNGCVSKERFCEINNYWHQKMLE